MRARPDAEIATARPADAVVESRLWRTDVGWVLVKRVDGARRGVEGEGSSCVDGRVDSAGELYLYDGEEEEVVMRGGDREGREGILAQHVRTRDLPVALLVFFVVVLWHVPYMYSTYPPAS